jgi:predicted ATP-dependent serine protease
MRLEEYKKNKSKRITELESKMKDLEILENLDLNKILEQLRNRDKKIVKLDRLEDSLNDRIEILQESHRQQTEELKR